MKNLLLILLLFFGACVISLGQSSNWTFTGPSDFPTNISGQINGIGRICQIKFDPNNNAVMFACSASGGLWKSTDTGGSWHQLGTDVLPMMGVASVCIDYTNSDIIYISSGDPNYYGNDFGIWKTIDGGISWAQLNGGFGNLMAVELIMDSTDHLTLLAASTNGIWKTIDGGLNWTNPLAGNQFTDMKWKIGSGTSIVFASSMNKFFRSTDRGDTWNEIVSGFGGLLANGTRLATSDNNPNIIYVGTVNDEGTIFKSTDAGLNFSMQYHNTAWSLTGYDSTGGGQGNYNFCLEANPDNADQLFLGSHNIMRSNDGGVTWEKLTVWWKTVHTDMHDYLFQPGNSNHLFQANDGGVWLTANEGVDWVQKSDGLGATENYHAAASPFYAGLISTGTQDNGELVFIDHQWKTNRGGDWTTKMQMDYSMNKMVYYFEDMERRALPSGGEDMYNVPSVVNAANIKHVFSPDDQNLGYVSGVSIWQTKNLNQFSPVWTQIVTGSLTIRAMAVCKSRPSIFAYCAGNSFYMSHNALSTTPTFTQSTLPLSASSVNIVISPNDTNLIFLILNQSVYKSIDGGLSFTNYSGTLPAVLHMKLFLDEYSGNNGLYLGNSLGVYYRNNTMSDWVNYSGVLPSIASIRDIMYFNDGGEDARVYVSYYGRGTWETKLENTHTCGAPSISSTSIVGATVVINWNNTGASQYEIQYREEGSLSWITITTPNNSVSLSSYAGCSKYEARVRAKCSADSSLWSNKSYFDTPSDNLNTDFDNHMDIGAVGAAGSVCYDAVHQRYTIYASGDDIWNTSDQFHFLYKKLSGDITISARVKHIGNIYGWAKGGVMIRETLNDDSKHAMCVLTPGNGFANQWRTNTNDVSDNVDTGGSEPGWVMLERVGNIFTAYFCYDGINWIFLNSVSIAMDDTVYIGLANCSHIDSTINDAIFDNVVINGQALSVSPLTQNNTPFVISPNPATDELIIEFSEPFVEKKQTVTIFDAVGKKLLSRVYFGKNRIEKLSIANLAVGVYYLEVEGHRKSVTTFIKE